MGGTSTVTPNQHLEVMERLQAVRTDIIKIMQGDNPNNYNSVPTVSDMEKAEKIINRLLSEVINHMNDYDGSNI